MVVEDQLGVGDVVDLGPATGIVEYVQIRITKVRDVNGTLWFVRNGEILRVGNMSQGWARVIIDLAVPYDADVDAVEAEMLRTAIEMSQSAQVALPHPREARGLGPRVDLRRRAGHPPRHEDAHVREGRRRPRAADAAQALARRDGREAAEPHERRAHRLRGRHAGEGREAAEDDAERGRDGCRRRDATKAKPLRAPKPPTPPTTEAPNERRDTPRRRPRGVAAPEPETRHAACRCAAASTAPRSALVLRRDRRSRDLRAPRRRVLPRRRRRPGAAADVSRGGPRPGRGAAHAVPRAVLGRTRHLQRAARPPAAADAARCRST